MLAEYGGSQVAYVGDGSVSSIRPQRQSVYETFATSLTNHYAQIILNLLEETFRGASEYASVPTLDSTTVIDQMTSLNASTSKAPTTNGTSVPASSSTGPTAPAPPELEQTLQMLSSHRTVLGVLLLSRASPPSIIRHSGVVFEGEPGKKYARAVGRIVDACKQGLEDVEGGDSDDLKFMRIRTKRHEIMISPDDRYLLVVLHDPTVV